jgi:hypothetical protein
VQVLTSAASSEVVPQPTRSGPCDFFFWIVYTNGNGWTGRDIKVEIGTGSSQTEIGLYSLIGRRVDALHAAADLASVRADFLDVDCCRHDFDVVETKLTSLSDDFTIDYYHCTSIIVQSVPVASL